MPSYVVLSSASEKRSIDTAAEQALRSWVLAPAGPAAAREVAAARPAVRVASTVVRRMAVTVEPARDARESAW
ncbi:hypothetical protein GCM10017687_16100 [Streptomyces echinatus]